MKPFCIASIGTILGIAMGLYLKSIALFLLIYLFIIILFHFIFKIIYKRKDISFLPFFVCIILFYTYVIFLENQYEQRLKQYEEQEVRIEAIVVSNPQEREYKNVYEIKVISIENLNEKNQTSQSNQIQSKQSFHLLCNVKKSKEENILLQYGDKISFITTLEIPSIARNEGGFDYRQYLKTKQISGTVTIKPNDITVLETDQANWIASKIHDLKNHLINGINNILPKETAGICIGLLLGEKDWISEDIQNDFRQSSLSHMLAISGAHVSYILAGIIGLFERLRFHKRWSKLFVIVFLLFYMALVGFTPSVTRACIMAILTLLADILFQKADVYQNLAISSFIILLINPYSIFDIGFQLSFGGTIGIVLFMNKNFSKKKEEEPLIDGQNKEDGNKLEIKEQKKFKIKKEKNKEQSNEIDNKGQNLKTEKIKENKFSQITNYIKQMIKVSISANLIILPIMLYHFNTLSATFLISNILASPILGYALILGMIFIIILLIYQPIAQLFSYLLNPILQLLIKIAHFSGELPFSQVLLPTPKLWQIAVYYLALFLLYTKLKLPKNVLMQNYSFNKKLEKLILIITIFLLISPCILGVIPSNYVTIRFIDVGQGDSMLIQTPSKKTILIDGGGSETGSFDVGQQTLLPYLLDNNILTIDYMIFTHFDTDHCGGLLTILEKYNVKNVIISKQGKASSNFSQFLELIQKKKVNVIVVKAGDKIKMDKQCYFDILFPTDDLISANILNNNSIVAKFYWQNYFSMLLTGDIEEIAEEKIVEKYKNTNLLQSTILKVAHHGSKSSSTEEFLELVKPKIALIGVGAKNTFGHPNQGVLERFKAYGTKVYRTDLDGEIVITVKKQGLKIREKIND